MLKAFCWALSVVVIVVGLCMLIFSLAALYWAGVADDAGWSLHWLALLGAMLLVTGILARRRVLWCSADPPPSERGFPVVRRSDGA
jgi:hypothetical protein